MNRMRLMCYISILLITLLAACAPAGTPAATEAPATTVSAANPPTAVPTAAPIDLAGPPMQVGSTYLYFDGALLVAVPGGSFTMGHGGSDNPEHTVTLSDYWIYSTKVTNLQYQQCVAVGKCTPPDTQVNLSYTDPSQESNPVVGVKWAQGEAYCEYANGQLPTEAQWEKAARGTDARMFPWGNTFNKNLLNSAEGGKGDTTAVGSYPGNASPYGAMDMAGNVWEWVWDWNDRYPSDTQFDPTGPSTGTYRVSRGGSWRTTAERVTCAMRYPTSQPTVCFDDIGFRTVRRVPQ